MSEGKKPTGPLRCPTNHHIMLRVARSLWMCDCYETGDMTSLKGAVEEARAILVKAGGAEALREKRRAKSREQAKKRRELKATTKEIYDQYGHYQPITIEDMRAQTKAD